jgi:N-acetylglucosaminyldiphosphoundecaprenol N-acetyl-beta-D-mannosaminyltransferase
MPARNDLQNPERICFMGCPVDVMSVDKTLWWIKAAAAERRPRQIAVVNANKFHLMARDQGLREIISGADLVIPEWAVVWGARRLGISSLIHSGGILVAQAFFPFAEQHGLRPYLLGSRTEVVELLARKIQSQYPALQLAGYHHGYMTTPEIEARAISEIAQSGADILFVAMGSPKQETWIHSHKEQLRVPVSIGVGGSFDVLAGLKADTPSWARGKGLEWVFRLWQDPRAYWKRYLITNTWFAWQVYKMRLTGGRASINAVH